MTAVAAPTDFLPGHRAPVAQPSDAGQDTLSDSGHPSPDSKESNAAVGTTSPQAIHGPTPNERTPAGAPLPDPTIAVSVPIQPTSGQEPTSGSGHHDCDDQAGPAAAGSDSPIGHPERDVHPPRADGGTDREGSAATDGATPKQAPLLDPSLALASLLVDDLERVRIAEENRLRSLTDPEMFGLTDEHPDVATLGKIIDALAAVEHDAILHLNRTVRRHPLGAWQKAQKGIGEKTFARFLATLGGDPYINHTTGQPRTVSQIWAYCGHGDPSRRKRKGMTQDDLFALGNPDAKKRLYLIATTCLKAQGHYAQVYYTRREQTAEREHATECVRCGPSGKPAQPGSPWSAAHQHADALRIVGKEILRDLWTEAKRIHEGVNA